MKIQMSWAIDLDGRGRSFLGRYWTLGDEPQLRDKRFVYRGRLFETRQEARAFLQEMKSQSFIEFPLARVVRVRIVTDVVAGESTRFDRPTTGTQGQGT